MPSTSGGSASSSSAPAPAQAEAEAAGVEAAQPPSPPLALAAPNEPHRPSEMQVTGPNQGAGTALGDNAACCSECGKEVDDLFISKLLRDLEIKDAQRKCRECKALRLLEECVEVDKYSYNGWLIKRKRKFLRLSKDRKEVSWWQKHSSSRVHVVPVNDILGVVFGAYTCTFKKQRPADLPPHWAAFSLVGRSRTYDFSARDPEVVECCVRMLQRVVWDRRSMFCTPALGMMPEGAAEAVHSSDKAAGDASQEVRQGAPPARPSTSQGPPCPDLGAFEPWPLGFFLWMRLRFRLQEEAQKKSLSPDHMLWTVFMRCAFLSSDEVSKARFIDMAEKLQQEHDFREFHGAEMRDISLKIRFQKEREMDIVKDRYECHIETFLPRAPRAVVGRRNSQSGHREEL